MKKTPSIVAIALILVLFFPPAASGSIGFKGGVHFATQRQGGAKMLGAQTGFFAGVFLPMEMNLLFTVQPEVMVIQKGSKKEVGDWMTYEVKTTLMCVDAAVISKIHPFRFQAFRPSFLFGPYASVLLSGTYDYGSSAETIDDYNKLEAGMVFGAAVDLTLGKSRIVLDLRYNLGWTDAHKVPSTIWNRGLLLGAGIVF